MILNLAILFALLLITLCCIGYFLCLKDFLSHLQTRVSFVFNKSDLTAYDKCVYLLGSFILIGFSAGLTIFLFTGIVDVMTAIYSQHL